MFGKRKDRRIVGVRVAVAGLCLTAAFAISLMAVASASAVAPEFGRCVKAKPGKYHDPGCEKGEVKSGTFEWEPGCIKCGFTSEEGKSTFETVNKQKIVCTSDSDQGHYIAGGNNKEDTEGIVFAGCTFSGLPCHELRTFLLRSVLGFIKKPTEVGVSLEPFSGTGPLFEFECGGLKIAISGSVIGKVTPISKMTLKFKEVFKAIAGKQKPEQFEGAPKDTLLCTVFEGGKELKSEQCGFTSTDTVTNEELLEVNEVL